MIFFAKIKKYKTLLMILIINLFASFSWNNDSLPVFSHTENFAFCNNKLIEFHEGQRRDYWVLYNYIRANKEFNCNESVTYTTLGDITFLDNLQPLIERWKGPVSVAIYAPGDDFEDVIETILYYKDCSNSKLISDFCTFHIIFDMNHFPKNIPHHETLLTRSGNCDLPIKSLISSNSTYRHQHHLVFPINLARNVARISASTHFVFASDIELYPSPNLIEAFLEMIKRNEGELQKSGPRVFSVPVFEIYPNNSLPETKKELVSLINLGKVISFHDKLCPICHKIPNFNEWKNAEILPGMNIFHVAKRVPPHKKWEPIYIGTNDDPLYDEDLSWEGNADKMEQMYKLCLMDYDFFILDTPFLIHKPGIKTKVDRKKEKPSSKVNAQLKHIMKTIVPKIEMEFGKRIGCSY